MKSLLLDQVTKLGLNVLPKCSFSLTPEWNFKPFSLEFPDR